MLLQDILVLLPSNRSHDKAEQRACLGKSKGLFMSHGVRLKLLHLGCLQSTGVVCSWALATSRHFSLAAIAYCLATSFSVTYLYKMHRIQRLLFEFL